MQYEISHSNRENTAGKNMSASYKQSRQHHVSVSKKQNVLSRKQTIAEIYAANIVSNVQTSIDRNFELISDLQL